MALWLWALGVVVFAELVADAAPLPPVWMVWFQDGRKHELHIPGDAPSGNRGTW